MLLHFPRCNASILTCLITTKVLWYYYSGSWIIINGSLYRRACGSRRTRLTWFKGRQPLGAEIWQWLCDVTGQHYKHCPGYYYYYYYYSPCHYTPLLSSSIKSMLIDWLIANRGILKRALMGCKSASGGSPSANSMAVTPSDQTSQRTS